MAEKREVGLLGKLPATDYGDDNVLLSSVLTTELPKAPKTFGHGTMFADWGMLGNDAVGDCAEAGSDHETMLLTQLGGTPAQFSTDSALKAYSEVAGYVPGDPSTDVGTRVDQLMDYRRITGLPDATGKRHKIDLAVRLSEDWQTFVDAVSAFKVVAVGTLIPHSAQVQFAEDKPWKYIGDEQIEGGHYIPAVGSMNSDNQVTIITWAKRQVMDRNFFEAYVDELWIPLSEEALKPIEFALHVVDWAKVEATARSLG